MSEVSRLASIAPATVRSWFLGRSDRIGKGPILKPDYDLVNGDRAFSFLDLIDALAIGRFREKGVKMSLVRQVHAILGEELGTAHPFARARLRTDGSSIVAEEADRQGNQTLHDAVTKQYIFECIHDAFERVDYSEITQLAERYRITEGVVIDPKIAFGKPVVERTGTCASIIARQYEANGRDESLVADLYEISESAVMNAVRFQETYGKIAA